MGLKQDIVLVNEFTVKGKATGKGSRGSTPGDYVNRYMARKNATEDLTPVRLQELDDYMVRYMARKDATDFSESVPELKQRMKKAQGLGGVAFGLHEYSLSDEKLKAMSKEIQHHFDHGKTCLKTVISFDTNYLKKMNVISEDFEWNRKGDFRGHIDQMKLRMAIMSGMERFSRSYDDLTWVGVIQVDTAHVHCHLCMVDRGKGKLAKDGTQKGKIDERAKRNFRRGVSYFLKEHQAIKQMSSNVTYDRRNALCYIKKFTHQTMNLCGTPQLLLACLPNDKRMWRAGTNAKEMKQANQIVKDYVLEVLNQENSGYKEALQHIDLYARQRVLDEDLSGAEYRSLVQVGKQRLLEDCMNGVYAILKKIPDHQKTIQTPMLDVMAANYETVAAHLDDDPIFEFGFKLRSYSSRMDYHKKQKQRFHEAKIAYEQAENAVAESKVLYDFYVFEEEYHTKLLCKYQHFLSFLPSKEVYLEEFNQMLDTQKRLLDLQTMLADPSLKRMKAQSAEDYGIRVYNQRGGSFVLSNPHVIELRIDALNQKFHDQKKELIFHLADYGLTLDEHGISTKKPYEFDDVKALDLHHLGYDFTYDFPIAQSCKDSFIEATTKREQLHQLACDYLDLSNQGDLKLLFPGKDIQLMSEFANQFRENPLFYSVKPVGGKLDHAKTVPVSTDYRKDFELIVKSTVQASQMNEFL